MFRNKLTFIYILAVSILGLTACDTASDRPDEGVITYEISYPIPFEDKWFERLMPKEMEMKFKGDLLKTELSFGMGMIKIAYLSDFKKRELYEMMKFMKKKNYALRNKEQVNQMMNSIPDHKITPGNATKMIAGYECKNAMVEVKNDTTDYQFELWYTEELGVPEVNWCSPFSPIRGMLMEYQVERFNVTMKFTAKKVELIKTDPSDFTISTKYSEISSQEMMDNIAELREI